MSFQPRVLVAGCGSIGRRHIKNLAGLGVRDFVLCDPDRSALVGASVGLMRPVLASTFDEALEVVDSGGVDAALVCTPSSMHLDMARKLVDRGVGVLIEKPLSDSLEGVWDLRKAVDEKGAVAMMAMCYRFHPVFMRLKEIVASEELGGVYHVNYFGGHFLPDWHPESDYRREYAARSELGGGVVLTSIHGLDNIRWLFGEVAEAKGFVDKVSGLEMDVEDLALGVLRLKGGGYVSWQSDFLNRTGTHRMAVTAGKGTLFADFITGTLEVFSPECGGWRTEKVDFDVNDMYIAELRHFLKCVEKGAKPCAGIDDGIRTLRLAIDLKRGKDKFGGEEKLCVA